MRKISLITNKILSLAILFAAFGVSAFGATITVNSTLDNGTNGCDAAECTLREAIAAAGAGDTIGFASPLFDSPQTITLTQGELAIMGSTSLTINGTGANRLSISGNNASRVFFVGTQATLTLNNLTVTDGKTDGNNGNAGAGIYNNGTTTINNSTVSFNSTPGGLGAGITNSTGMLTVNNSIISGNSAPGGFSGGIYNDLGTITISNSTVSGNSAVGNGTNSSVNGGGIFNNSGDVTITNSTISGNFVNNSASGIGGGIFNESGMITLTNSTVSGNSVSGEDSGIGGGIFNGGEIELTNSTVSGNTASAFGGGIFNATNSFLRVKNSTISGNTASSGAGIYNQVEGTLTLRSVTVAFNTTTSNGGGVYTDSGINLFNTIVAKNNGPAAAPDFSGEISSHSSFNLIGNGTGMNGITNSNGNQVGTSANPIDPKLDPSLALNGGTTRTHALLFGSPALDQGDEAGTDQRGLQRPVDLPSVLNGSGNIADIGAFEAQTAPAGPTAATVSISGRVTTASGRGIRSVQITMTDANGNARQGQTTAFGYYRFGTVAAGETVTLTAKAKQFRFDQSSIVRTTNESISDADFVSEK